MNPATICHQVLGVISARHSTRAYTDKPVNDEQLHEILGTARWAPSGVNTQPWQVAIVRGQTKQTITEHQIGRAHV